MLQKNEVERKAHEEKKIPFFFQQFWAMKMGENPLSNEDKYRQMDTKSDKWFCIGLIACIICILLVLLVALFSSSIQPEQLMDLLVIVIGVIIFIICSTVAYRVSPNRKKGWHFKDYYARLFELFDLFEITPSTEVGKLSKEEFAGLIAGSLRAKMCEVDKLEGFARLADYGHFKHMHAAALKWGLADPDYGKYDPAKQRQ